MNRIGALKLDLVRNVLSMEHLPFIKNLSELIEFLREQGMCEGDIVISIKEIFDKNLPPLYNAITGASGMCGYWSLVYSKLFSLLGYNASICQIDTSSIKFIHTFVRVVTNDSSIDLDRDATAIVPNKGYSSLTTYWTDNITKHYKATPLIYDIRNTEQFKLSFFSNSKVMLDDNILNELLKFTKIIAIKDISSYHYIPLRELCDSFLLRILLGRASTDDYIRHRMLSLMAGR